MAEIQSPRRSDTDIAYILYAMHAIAPFTLWTLAAIAVFFGYVSRDRVARERLEAVVLVRRCAHARKLR